MKYILTICFATMCLHAQAQVKGNKVMVTERIKLSEFSTIDLGLYANYEIDLSADEPYLEISIDENLLEKVEKKVKGNTLHVDQLEWIRSSQDIKVRIGGTGVTHIIHESHATTTVYNINQENLNYSAEVGKVQLSGNVQEVALRVGTAEIDAKALNAETGTFQFDSWGTILITLSEQYTRRGQGDGKLIINDELVGIEKSQSEDDIRFINFTLKNNSTNRHNFYVIGPKPDGTSFSYGFPMMPFQTRDKNWTNGTKVYKVNKLGIKQLVATITLEDEGELVDIFSK